MSLVTALFAVGLIANFPLSLELGQWYSMPSKVVFAMVAALAAYGLSAALRSTGAQSVRPSN